MVYHIYFCLGIYPSRRSSCLDYSILQLPLAMATMVMMVALFNVLLQKQVYDKHTVVDKQPVWIKASIRYTKTLKLPFGEFETEQ
mmetsp:Transcript_17595/g.28120  ORF Transcript_17595/g.28120 Transcript_17595/m.28120 type:complete len:85 (+) Transcript_17595:344-598(+)